MIETVTTLITILLYCLAVYGIWLIFSRDILYMLKVMRPRKTFRKKKRTSSSVYKHIKRLLQVVYGDIDDKKVSTFFVLSILLFMITFLVVYQRTTVTRSLGFASIFGFLPYFYLRMQLKQIRVDGSYEADILINEFLNQYKLNNHNVYDTIDETIHKIKEAPMMKRQLFLLSLKLKEYRKTEELEDIIDDFIYAIDTEWIVLLANNMLISIEDHVDITSGLEDIQAEIKQAIADKEREKRINLESITIVKYLTPGLYILSIILAKKVFNISFKEFMHYQLNTPTGFDYFMIIVLLTIFNHSILVYLKKQKFDI